MPKNNFFQFKQFRINQERSAMKVGIDGVLIGSWVDVEGCSKILDIGTGTGLIALMMAQRNELAKIDAVEIEQGAYEEAIENFRLSNWATRIQAYWSSFQVFAKNSLSQYDLIISNPPYFNNGLKATIEIRAKARHSDSLPLAQLIESSCRLLKNQGKIAMILPSARLDEIEHLASANKLFVSRICSVFPNANKPAHRIMIELTKLNCTSTTKDLMIESEVHHDYTLEYKNLTKDFYLKF
jgi:tRNA1Val (adenine37-N6)-methyltransferase